MADFDQRAMTDVAGNTLAGAGLRRSSRIAAKKESEAKCDISILGIDLLSRSFGFLDWNDNLCLRVCKRWREAARRTSVPPSIEGKVVNTDWPCEVDIPQLGVTSAKKYAALDGMRRALPGLQQIFLGEFYQDSDEDVSSILIGVPKWALLQPGGERKYEEGDDPNEETLFKTRDFTAYDVNIIADFHHLRHLHIKDAPLNGKYPCLFAFRELRELRITDCPDLKWEISMLAGLPKLELLECSNNAARGNIKSLSIVKETLRELVVGEGTWITGNFMDLADFPQLETLDFKDATDVMGDVCQIEVKHFPKLKKLDLPKVIDLIEDSPQVVRALIPLAKRLSCPCISRVQLSDESPDYFQGPSGLSPYHLPYPPFGLEVIKEGTRVGWRWSNWSNIEGRQEVEGCETNWIDPEPHQKKRGSPGKRAERSEKFYAGYFMPPTEEQYADLCRIRNEREYQKRRAIGERFYAAIESGRLGPGSLSVGSNSSASSASSTG